MSFNSSGFRMYLRQPPQQCAGHWLALRQRRGISFDVPKKYQDEDEKIWNDVKSWYHL